MLLFRDAWRALRAAPVVSAVAVLSLAFGIGATTAMFSIVDALLLRSLPVREPDRLVRLSMGGTGTSFTNPLWEQIRDRQSGVLDGALAWSATRFDLSQGGETEFVDGLFTSGSYFDVIGVPAARGRLYSLPDDRRGGGPGGAVAVISHAFWLRRFGGVEDVVGRTIALQRVPFTILGVTAPGFSGLEVGRSFDVAVPLGTEAILRGRDSILDRRSTWWLTVLARLRPGQTPEDAAAALDAQRGAIRDATVPENYRPEERSSYLDEPFDFTPAASGTSSLRTRYQRPLQTLMTVVSLVLLIACANIANLLLARATARRKELGVRLALGASRWRLARQLFAESLLLAGLGAIGGLVVAEWGSALLVRQLSTQVATVFLDAGLDWRMLGFTAALTVATALVFGTAPAWRAGRVSAGEVLAGHTRGGSESKNRLASGLVVAQVALSLVLVAGAGLFLRTFSALATRDLGLSREGVLIVSVNALRSAVPPEGRLEHFERLRQAMAGVPGVAAVSASAVTPISGSSINLRVQVPSRPDASERDRTVFANDVTPDWFRTYGTAVLYGRDFLAGDSATAPGAAIVNEKLAAQIFGTDSPIGQTLTLPGRPGTPDRTLTIVGVVRDAAYRSLREPVPATLYLPLAQTDRPPTSLTFSLKSTIGFAALSRAVGDTIRRADRDLAFTFRALDDQVNAALVQERLLATLSAFFGALALLLAGLGLYGVTAYAVSRRRMEMGIRLALGATPGGVLGLVFRRVTWLVGLGIFLGALASYWAGSFVSALTFGVDARDPMTVAAAALALAATGAAAAWRPARRASRLDPACVLHEG